MTSITPAKSVVTVDGERTRNGVIAALFAYCVWGFFPILFHMLDAAGSELIVAHRIIWSLVLVGGILLIGGRFGEVKAALRDGATLRRLIVSAVLVACNWLVYVWAVGHNMLLETSFGYFLNPLVNVAIGMVMLGERQNRWQWVAIIIAAIAMAIQAVGVGGVPWVALSLAISFALYGYFRKTVNAGSATGLFVETLLLSPIALGYVAYTFIANGPGPHGDPKLMFLLILTGPATSLSLLLFAYAVQRLRLTTIGMFQYIAPSIQFVLAIVLFGEHLNLTRLISFALIWLSLIVFSADSFRRRNDVTIPV